MSIFNFNNGTLLTQINGVTYGDTPEDFHIINTSLKKIKHGSIEHGLLIAGGNGAAENLTWDFSTYNDNIFIIASFYDDTSSVIPFYINKTTGAVRISNILTAGSYGNLPKWVSRLEKSSSDPSVINAIYNDGSVVPLTFNISRNVNAKILSANTNSLAEIIIQADSVPYNGTLTITSSKYSNNKFDVGYRDEWSQNTIFSSAVGDTNNTDRWLIVKNSSGTTIDTLIYQSVPSLVEVRVGSVFTISKGKLVNIKY